MINRMEQRVLHIRFQGRSADILLADLDIGSVSSDADIKRALAGFMEVPQAKFANYVVDRHATGNITVRPEAVFG